MNAIAKFFRNLLCKHEDLIFVRKTSGDENNYALSAGGRYVHRCRQCGRTVFRKSNEEEANA